MTIEFLTFLAIGAFAGGFVNGLAGFGTALFALSWWLQVMTPLQAVALVLAMSVASGLQGVALIWHAIDWRRLARFLVPALVGVPFGLQVLELVDATVLKLMVAGFLILYGGFFAFRRGLPNLTRKTPVLDGAIGFAGGFLGAVAGLSGALPTMWCSLRPWPKAAQRAVLQPFNVIILGISAVLLAFKGGYTGGTLVAIAIALPMTLISARAGIFVFKRLSDDQFRRLLIGLMFVSGVVLMLRELV